MNFNNVVKSKHYFTINEAKTFRKQIWDKNKSLIEKLNQDLFDDFDLEESIYIINDFFDKNVYSLNKIDLLIKLNKNKFEEIVESRIMRKYEADDIQFHFLVDNKCYHYNNSFFKKENVLLEIIKPYND